MAIILKIICLLLISHHLHALDKAVDNLFMQAHLVTPSTVILVKEYKSNRLKQQAPAQCILHELPSHPLLINQLRTIQAPLSASSLPVTDKVSKVTSGHLSNPSVVLRVDCLCYGGVKETLN